jgi:DNA-binding LytR/AlgR family response regulator
MTPSNSPVTALIAEDETLLAQALQAELKQAWPELHLLGHAQDGDEAVEQALALQPQVLFLDIRMPGRSGLEAAQAVVEDWPEGHPLPLIVFVTAYDQYALQAFEACAVDYLLKPVQPARLVACCERLKTLLAHRQAVPAGTAHSGPSEALLAQLRSLLQGGHALGPTPPASERLSVLQASVGSAVHMVPIEDVLYFEAADKYVRVITTGKEHLIRTSLRELLPQLDPQQFWQIHRGTVVQARAVAQALRDDQGRVQLQVHARPEKLPVSRLYAARFKGM